MRRRGVGCERVDEPRTFERGASDGREHSANERRNNDQRQQASHIKQKEGRRWLSSPLEADGAGVARFERRLLADARRGWPSELGRDFSFCVE